jgi:arylsulfatase A-like enzyme
MRWRSLAGSLAILFSAGTAIIAEARPNVIWIVLDDYGWADSGCYASTYHQTPNIDAFARRGVRFTSAYGAARSARRLGRRC